MSDQDRTVTWTKFAHARLQMLFVVAVVVSSDTLLSAQDVHRETTLQLRYDRSASQTIRGVTIGPIESSRERGRNGEALGYGSAASEKLLDHLSDMGVNYVSITPFGRIWSLHSPQILYDFEDDFVGNRANVVAMIRAAKARGMKVLLIPHLWVETTGWRGEIDFADEAGWARYHEAYREFLLTWARVAAEGGADALSIGVECKSWSGRFGGVWTAMISDVRAVFRGQLTYSANWDEAENVLFWDQLDFVGINAFYPLAHEHEASDEDYAEGAAQIVPGLADLAKTLQMPIVFVEVGYTTRANAAVEPWVWPDGLQNVRIDEREQARGLAASLDAMLPQPWFGGFFVWRYYANLDDVSQESFWGFSPHAKLAEPVLERVFKSATIRDASAGESLDPTRLRLPATPRRAR